jgi:hypothetical protein
MPLGTSHVSRDGSYDDAKNVVGPLSASLAAE